VRFWLKNNNNKTLFVFFIIVLCLFLYIVFLGEVFLFCREEGSLVEQFVFEALVTYMESLALAHEDEKSLGRCHSSVLFAY
jgi:hypothetical protein